MNDLILPQEFVLPRKLDNLEGFKLFDEQAELAGNDINDANARFAFHTYMILKYKLWRWPRNEIGGAVWESQEEYIVDLASRVGGFAASTIKLYFRALRMAHHLGYTTLEMIEERGLWVFAETSKLVELERKSFKPVKLKRGVLPDGIDIDDFLREVIDEYGGSINGRYRPSDHKFEMMKKLQPGAPIVYFSAPDDRHPWRVMVHVEMYENQMLVTFDWNGSYLDQGRCPGWVIEEYHRRLRIEQITS